MGATLTPLDLDALEQKARAATPGEWRVEPPGYKREWWSVWGPRDPVVARMAVSFVSRTDEADAAFIAAACPSTVLALVARVREAEGALERIDRLGGGVYAGGEPFRYKGLPGDMADIARAALARRGGTT